QTRRRESPWLASLLPYERRVRPRGAGRAKATLTSGCLRQILHDIHPDSCHRSDHELRDTVAWMDDVGLATPIFEDDMDFASVVGVDGTQDGHDAPGSQPGARSHLSLVAVRYLGMAASRHPQELARLQDAGDVSAEVQACRALGGISGRRDAGVCFLQSQPDHAFLLTRETRASHLRCHTFGIPALLRYIRTIHGHRPTRRASSSSVMVGCSASTARMAAIRFSASHQFRTVSSSTAWNR